MADTAARVVNSPSKRAGALACALLLTFIWAGGVLADSRFEASRVVAFGDVHGAFGALTRLLVDLELLDSELAWHGGDTHLVSLGDLVDRGPESRAVLDLLRRLQVEAAAAGGRVHVLLGNHELMNLTGDLRYVSAAERAAFADLAPAASADDDLAGVRAAYAPDGPYGAWLLQQPVTVVINDTVFVHGGLAPMAAGLGPDGVNEAARNRLRELLTLQEALEAEELLAADMEVHDAAERLASGVEAEMEPERARLVERFIELVEDPLFADAGPFWYRGNARCHPLLEAPGLARVLESWQVRRVVIGHTPTPDRRVRERLGGRVLMSDTGMLESYYGGRAAAVVIEGETVGVAYAGEIGRSAPVADGGAPLEPLSDPEVLSLLRSADPKSFAGEGWRELPVGASGRVKVAFSEASARSREAELAALRLDRMLGLQLVAPVAVPEADGDALAVATWPTVVTETERAATQAGGPTACAGGSAFDLLYAFDALIGNQGRSADTIIYDARTWRLGSIRHGDSFGRSRNFPAYLKGVPGRLPAALAERLAALDETTLQAELGDLLNTRQIRAVLARRDRLLSQWPADD